MVCILRVFGQSLDVDALLAQAALTPDRVWRRGEPRFVAGRAREAQSDSGVTFLVSDADMSDFEAQVQHARDFLETYQPEVEKLVAFPGVQGVDLDFGVELRDVAVHSDYLPPALIQAAARTGIGLELSHYPCSDETDG